MGQQVQLQDLASVDDILEGLDGLDEEDLDQMTDEELNQVYTELQELGLGKVLKKVGKTALNVADVGLKVATPIAIAANPELAIPGITATAAVHFYKNHVLPNSGKKKNHVKMLQSFSTVKFNKDFHDLNDEELEALFTELEKLGLWDSLKSAASSAGSSLKAAAKTAYKKTASAASSTGSAINSGAKAVAKKASDTYTAVKKSHAYKTYQKYDKQAYDATKYYGKKTLAVADDVIDPVADVGGYVMPQYKVPLEAARIGTHVANSYVNGKLDMILENLSEEDLDRL